MTTYTMRIAKPGAGKTTELMKEAQQTLAKGGTSLLLCFGKKNQEDMENRLGWMAEEKAKRSRVMTLHAAAFRHMKAKKETNLTRYLFEHDRDFGIRFGQKAKELVGAWTEGDPIVLDGETDDDKAYAECMRLRSRRLSWKDTEYSGGLAERVRGMFNVLERGFERGFWDFTRLLEYAVESGMILEADYVGVDEINDLTPLQLEICKRLKGERIVYVGDPEQCVHSWNGVDRSALYTLPADKMEVREESWRLNAQVAERAETILEQLSYKVQGKIKPMNRETGEVRWEPSFIDVLAKMKSGEWGNILVLGRTNYIVEQARRDAYRYGVNVAWTEREEKERRLWQMIQEGNEYLDFNDAPCILGSWLPANRFFRKNGKRDLAEFIGKDTNGSLPWRHVIEWFGTPELKRLKDGEVTWYSEERRTADPKKPFTRFLTVHSAKGLEEETVVYLRDLDGKTYGNLWRNRDEEIRLTYVAVTRAKKRLIVTENRPKWVNMYI